MDKRHLVETNEGKKHVARKWENIFTFTHFLIVSVLHKCFCDSIDCGFRNLTPDLNRHIIPRSLLMIMTLHETYICISMNNKAALVSPRASRCHPWGLPLDTCIIELHMICIQNMSYHMVRTGRHRYFVSKQEKIYCGMCNYTNINSLQYKLVNKIDSWGEMHMRKRVWQNIYGTTLSTLSFYFTIYFTYREGYWRCVVTYLLKYGMLGAYTHLSLVPH